MKATVYTKDGTKKSEIELPSLFNTKIREDIVKKFYEIAKLTFMKPYSSNEKAGKKHSASGTISHKRHDWKGHYGHGYSRIPRKTMWRRGTQFFWVGAEVSSTRGGRRSHPPKTEKNIFKKINKKESSIAMHSALSATTKKDYILNRYSSLTKLDITYPIILELDDKDIKSKKVFELLKNILGETFKIAIKNKKIRAGKGKLRGRKYKSNAGILLITGNKEEIKIKGIDIKPIWQLSILDLYPLGRLSIYTKKAIEELGDKQ